MQLLILASLSLGIMALLFFLTVQGTPKNGFERMIRSNILIMSDSVPLTGIHYFAGTSSNTIFLGIRGEPVVLRLNHARPSTSVRFDLPAGKYKIKIDSPHVFFEQYGYDRIFYGLLSDHKITDTLSIHLPLIDVEPLSKTSLAALTLTDEEEFVLGKKAFQEVHLFPGLLKKQIDGTFCTDGMLKYNKQHAKLVWVYYYRNQFLCLDTSMNLQYMSKTIDTVSRANITVATIHSERARTLSSPARVVNKRVHTSGDFILVHSTLIADHEDKIHFSGNMALDVYAIQNGDYLFSFYIPKNNHQDALDFLLEENLLFVLFKDCLKIYEINFRDSNFESPQH
jgi:hypothetical protein